METIKTIDIQAKEWFDKINGNSYFSAVVTINFAMPGQRQYKLPFQYGYGEHYIDMASKELEEKGEITLVHHNNGSTEPLWRYCEQNKIVLRYNKQKGCKKADVRSYGF